MVLLHVPELPALEADDQWKKAALLLRTKWQKAPDDLGLLLRLISECWYVLSLWDCCIPEREKDEALFASALREGMDYGDARFLQNSDYLLLTGYCLAIRPDLFVRDPLGRDYEKIEAEGHARVKRATELAPESPVAQVLYSGFVNDWAAYRLVQQRNAAQLLALPWGDSAVERYFLEILTRDIG